MKQQSFLLVDANPNALRELSGILKEIGFRDIQQANNASDAWGMLRVKTYFCIISAWDMPEMSGLALLRIARGDDRLFHLPFFLTDPAFTKVKVIQAGQYGVTGLIVRPYDIHHIREKVTTLAGHSADVIPSEAQELLDEGLALIEGHNYQKALEVFESLTAKCETAEYYYNIGYIKTVQEKYSDAVDAFQKATQLDRFYAKAYEAMGRAYSQMGNTAEAEKYLQMAADIYMSKDKVENAEEILNEILQIRPETINVYNSLGVLYRKKGDLENALQNYLKALKVHPEEPHIHYNIGRLHLEMKSLAEAKKFFTQAIRLKPGFQEAREVLSALELVVT
ncbi:MAG: tetratricopeptide repeat protein [Thermodesulfobacteriota bacterium]